MKRLLTLLAVALAVACSDRVVAPAVSAGGGPLLPSIKVGAIKLQVGSTWYKLSTAGDFIRSVGYANAADSFEVSTQNEGTKYFASHDVATDTAGHADSTVQYIPHLGSTFSSRLSIGYRWNGTFTELVLFGGDAGVSDQLTLDAIWGGLSSPDSVRYIITGPNYADTLVSRFMDYTDNVGSARLASCSTAPTCTWLR